jgi:16S rRNA (adenine1518-N6/adenine1519-N6)-dimethyltransferase
VQKVKAKKNLGQHFLKDPAIAANIVNALTGHTGYKNVLEIGPGMGILTDFLFAKKEFNTKVIDLDEESINYLHQKYPFMMDRIIHGDFLQTDLHELFNAPFAVIGNFPYNISTQILFKILDYKEQIPEIVGMFQKEVAERIAGTPTGREYGILSVLMQTWYEVKLIIQLNQEDFDPPPKVKSAVLHLIRKEDFQLQCDAKLFKSVIKTAFNQRRKTLSNAMSPMVPKEKQELMPFRSLRAEALSWQEFVTLTNFVSSLK